MTLTAEQKAACVDVILTIRDTIKEAGEIPAGHIYAMCCGVMDFRSFQAIINLLVDEKLVRYEPSHLLVWIGPK